MNERTVYLISEVDSDGEQAAENWVEANHGARFDSELEGWYTDPGFWPANRTIKLFREWFEIEDHSVVEDTVGEEIYDDEA